MGLFHHRLSERQSLGIMDTSSNATENNWVILPCETGVVFVHGAPKFVPPDAENPPLLERFCILNQEEFHVQI